MNKYWHVVTIGNVTSQLYNLTIHDGNALGPISTPLTAEPFIYQHSSGGGMYIMPGSNVKLNNVIIKNNNCGITDHQVHSKLLEVTEEVSKYIIHLKTILLIVARL